MHVASQGVDANALTQGAALLSRPAEEYENDANVEEAWAVQAFNYADVYFNIICSADPKLLKLTADDDRIYEAFQKAFPDLEIKNIKEESLKSPSAKQKWRSFLEAHKNVNDYNFGTLLRLNSEQGYTEENTTLVPRLQFLAIEIARNRRGLNSYVWHTHASVAAKQSQEAEH